MNDTETKEPIEKKVPMVLLKAQLKTRAEKRRAKREVTIILEALMPVDNLFNKMVLSETTEKTDSVSYEDLYKTFHTLWNLRIRMLRFKDLRLATPNAKYFASQYSPKISEL